MIFLSANCLAKEEYKYAGVIWDEKGSNPIIFRVLFKSQLECETDLKKLIDLTWKTSKIKQYFVCSSVFVGVR